MSFEKASEFKKFNLQKWADLSSGGIFEKYIDESSPRKNRILSVVKELERIGEVEDDAGFCFSVATHLASTITPLVNFGSEDIKHTYLPALVSGNYIGAHAISEPFSGSDVLSMETRAEVHDDGFLLSGRKAFVTNGPIANVVVVYAKTKNSNSVDSLTAFLVDIDSPGVELGPPLQKSGLHNSPLCTMTLRNCRVSRKNLVGRIGGGVAVMTHVMKHEILYSFIINIGQMKRRIDRCVAYALRRKQFDQAIGSFQSISNRLAEMKINYELSRNWMYHVAEKMSEGRDITMEISVAKVFVSESTLASAINASHIHGGYGFLAASGLAEGVCDALAGTIYSGTNDIQRNRISALLGLPGSNRGSGDNPKTPRVTFESLLRDGEVLDCQHPDVSTFVENSLDRHDVGDQEKAVRLYYAVRDKIDYEVFGVSLQKSKLKASEIINSGRGFCLHKAITYTAACRYMGLASRLVASKVRNHLSSKELEILVGGDVFLHWYSEVFINGVWVKVSPTFNRNLTMLYGYKDLNFNGIDDAINHDFGGKAAMQYIGRPRIFNDPVYEDIVNIISEHHPRMVNEKKVIPGRKEIMGLY